MCFLKTLIHKQHNDVPIENTQTQATQ